MRNAIRESIDILGARLILLVLLVFGVAFVFLFPLSEHFATARAEARLNTQLQQQLDARSSSLRSLSLTKFAGAL